jgi:hypothetical protein
MAAWIGGGAAWISGVDDGQRRRRGRPRSAVARRGSAAAQPGSAALTTAGGGGEGGRRCAAVRLGSASQVGWGARVVGEAARLKRKRGRGWGGREEEEVDSRQTGKSRNKFLSPLHSF